MAKSNWLQAYGGYIEEVTAALQWLPGFLHGALTGRPGDSFQGDLLILLLSLMRFWMALFLCRRCLELSYDKRFLS